MRLAHSQVYSVMCSKSNESLSALVIHSIISNLGSFFRKDRPVNFFSVAVSPSLALPPHPKMEIGQCRIQLVGSKCIPSRSIARRAEIYGSISVFLSLETYFVTLIVLSRF